MYCRFDPFLIWRHAFTINCGHKTSYIPPPYFFHEIVLYAPCTVDECHAWFHLYDIHLAVMNGKQAQQSKWKCKSQMGIEPATPRFATLHFRQLAGCVCIPLGVCTLRQSANPRSECQIICCIACRKRLYRTFSGLSGRLGSSVLPAPVSESTTERSGVSNDFYELVFFFTVTIDIDHICTCVWKTSRVWDFAKGGGCKLFHVIKLHVHTND